MQQIIKDTTQLLWYHHTHFQNVLYTLHQRPIYYVTGMRKVQLLYGIRACLAG